MLVFLRRLHYSSNAVSLKTWALFFLVGCSLSGASWAHDSSSPCAEHDDKAVYFHRINYVLPFYRSSNLNTTALPNGLMGDVRNQEFKGQLSLKAPLFRDIFSENLSLYIAYTQLSYWQIYVSSPYFRDTNYQPEVFLAYHATPHWYLYIGAEHESNGRGNHLERSWNRGFVEAKYKNGPWTFKVKPWITMFETSSIDVHNPDIVHFLGNSQTTLGYQWDKLSMFLEVTNIESGLKQGHQALHINYKLKSYLYIYLQGFNGYGQSLIDYNRRSTGFGIGFSFNSGLDG